MVLPLHKLQYQSFIFRQVKTFQYCFYWFYFKIRYVLSQLHCSFTVAKNIVSYLLVIFWTLFSEITIKLLFKPNSLLDEHWIIHITLEHEYTETHLPICIDPPISTHLLTHIKTVDASVYSKTYILLTSWFCYNA